jgi:protein SCO1/2
MKELVFLICMTSCWISSAAEAQTASSPQKPACCTSNTLSSSTFSETSLYQLDSIWTSADERKLKLSEIKGKVQILTMFFARCEFACPILVHDMKRIEAALPPSLRTNVSFVLVSFDTERDTPDALRTFRTRMQLDADRWTLLRGSADDVLELAALLGVKFRKDSRGQFAHSNVITVLNSGGEIAYQQIGLNTEVEPTVAAISKIVCKSESH